MAQTVDVAYLVRKRWFFRPALFVLMAAAVVRLPRDHRRVAKWLADHALVVEAR